jgi:hypothetical protein
MPIMKEGLDTRYKDAVLDDGTMQLWTHKHQTDSMYLALLKRND